MKLSIQDTFNKELPADPELSNTRRQVHNACYSFVTPRVPSAPKIIHYSKEMLKAIGLTETDAASKEFTQVFSGAEVLEHTEPFAMCYAGHQFGGWSGQLGDGRAINLFEVIHENKRWALQLKGAGATPYSRRGDGFAVLRSSIREHLCSEAMYHLGVPTTRSLSLALTGDKVLRDVLYDGNPAYENGAVVCRVAPSFIRFGNFQVFAARQDYKTLKELTDYTLTHFFPHIKERNKEAYLQFYKEVTQRTLEMVIHWQRLGFVHGVMNTDNMSILGLTIDYGPYGWLEGYEHGWTPNTTDAQGKRYRFGNQPKIALWNLLQLGNALYPLIEEVSGLEAVLKFYQEEYPKKRLEMFRQKLGLQQELEGDKQLSNELERILHLAETDMTIFFRNLGNITLADDVNAAFDKIKFAFYNFDNISDAVKLEWNNWLQVYLDRLRKEGSENSDLHRKERMNKVNPKYVLRNYMAQLAIDEADAGDYSLINELYTLLKKPYDEQAEYEKWFAKRPEWARHKVGCSMLSCSS